MANTIHLGEKYREALLEGFREKSYTESSFSHALDQTFSGVRTVHVMSLKTEPLQDYNRNVSVGSGSRYGETTEVGDFVQTFTMTQDKALSLSVDKGNNAEQFNVKKAGAIMAAERDEHIVPYLDRYRLEKWAKEAGIHKSLSAEPTKSSIVAEIIELHNEMMDAGVPASGCTLFIPRKYVPALKLSSEWTALDSLGGKSLPTGSIGEVDGLAVKPIPTSRFPSGAYFMILHKDAVIAPMKINDFKGHTDPPGLSGDLLEFRMMFDAFVLGPKCNGVAVACAASSVAAAPTITLPSGNATLASTTSGAVMLYTTDGSDPRYSKDAKTYTAAFPAAAGTRIRAVATKDGMFSSDLTEKTA